MPPPTPDPDHFAAYADGLVQRLPGHWAVLVRPLSTNDTSALENNLLWDDGISTALVHHALQDAVLGGPGSTYLHVFAHPYRHQYLVSSLVPLGTRHYHLDDITRPPSITVPTDPARAAAQVRRRVLPHYKRALEQLRAVAAADPPAPTNADAPARVEMTWLPSGQTAASTRHAGVIDFLEHHGFRYHAELDTFVLDLPDQNEITRRTRDVAQGLGAQSVQVTIRPSPAPVLISPPTAPAYPTPPAPSPQHRKSR